MIAFRDRFRSDKNKVSESAKENVGKAPGNARLEAESEKHRVKGGVQGCDQVYVEVKPEWRNR